MRNFSHLKILCDPLHEGQFNCVATFKYENLLTLCPVTCEIRTVVGVVFSDWMFCSNSRAQHLDSRNVTSSVVVGVSAREAVISSHSRCVSASNVVTSNDLTLNLDQAHSMIMPVERLCD